MKKIVYALILNVLSWPLAVQADDIDIYIQQPVSSVPLLMLSLDFSSNLTSSLARYNQAEALFTEKAWEKLEANRENGDRSNVTRLEAFIAVLEAVIDTPKLDDAGNPVIVDGVEVGLYDSVYLGLMVPNKGGNSFDGGNIIEGYKNIGEFEEELIATLRSIDPATPTNDMHKFQLKETFMEWHRYLNAGQVIFGNNVSTVDNFGGFVSRPGTDPTNKTHAYGPEADQEIFLDTDSFQSHYKDPLPDGFECPKLFAIVMSMEGSDPGQDSALDSVISSEMSDQITTAPDMLQYMNQNNMIDSIEETKLTTWVITDLNNSGNTRGDVGELADAGGGGEALDISNPVALEVSLGEILNNVIEVSSTFVAATVPVNVFNRAESLDNLYIALFEARPTINWPGNLKKLKLNDSDSDGVDDEIVDVYGHDAFQNSGVNAGRINQGALTYWTLTAELDDSYTASQSTGQPLLDADGGTIIRLDEDGNPVLDEDGEPVVYVGNDIVNVDGREVVRGGAGQIVPGFIDSNDARNLWLEDNDSLTLIDFETIDSSASADSEEINRIEALLGVPYTGSNPEKSVLVTEADTLINWAHGLDSDGDARAWMMGASIHSQPLAINYGTRGSGYDNNNPNILIMMGTNDGVFHIFENTATDGAESGKEVFGFIPRDLLPNFKLQKNEQSIFDDAGMVYGVDGEITSLVVDNDSDGTIGVSYTDAGGITIPADEAYIYFGLRRGGKAYYALDVSNPDVATTPPRLAWTIDKSGDFSELGLTFSTPKTARLNINVNDEGTITTTATDVLIFGGGYDERFDDPSYDPSDDLTDAATEGNTIYIVNARTGELIWKAVDDDMIYSIPSSVTVVDSDSNGIDDRLYVGDSNGIVWRVDLGENDTLDDWFVTKFADVSGSGRRFFHSPDVVLSKDAIGNFDGVLIATGDRASPLEQDAVNVLVYLKDRHTVSGSAAAAAATTIDGSTEGVSDVTGCIDGEEFANDSTCLGSKAVGWYIRLTDTGEKGLSSPLVDAGTAIFTSYAPNISLDICAKQEGSGFAYIIDLATGQALGGKQKHDLGPGIPPGAVAISGAVLFPGSGVDVGMRGAEGDEANKIQKSKGKGHWLIYWREKGIDDL